MIIIPNVNKENSCFDCPVWSLCWDSKPTCWESKSAEDICKDRCPIVEFEGVELFDDDMPTIEAEPTKHYNTESYKMTVTDFPPVEYAPIKHGRWIKSEKSDYNWECSNCGYGLTDYRTTYCYDCGAKMDAQEVE